MDDPKQQIKDWLKAIKKDRFWLAEQCFVTKRTIDNWLSGGDIIPQAKMVLIQRLMADDQTVDKSVTTQMDRTLLIQVKISEEQEVQLDKYAQEQGLRLEKYTRQEGSL